MQHFILRCKHCNKEYVYCTYGNGQEFGTEAGCSMEYCAECQKAIDLALGKIPVKFEARGMEIHEPMLFDLFYKLKCEHSKSENELFPMIVEFSRDGWEWDWIETYYHDGKKFEVKWNDDEEDKHVFLFMEYDLQSKNFTDKVWKFDSNDSYSIRQGGRKVRNDMMKRLGSTLFTADVPAMVEPTGQLFFMDLPFNRSAGKEPEKKKEHKPRLFDFTGNGDSIKFRIEHGWGKNEFRVQDSLKPHKLIPYLDYKFYCIQYEDEDFVTLYKIECV